MPIHDWQRVEAGIFHDFQHTWIDEIKKVLNQQILPDDYYALAEQRAAGFGPDVLTLQTAGETDKNLEPVPRTYPMDRGLALAPPRTRIAAEADLEFYRRKQSSVVVRHVSGDHMVAVLEIVSLGNKSSGRALGWFTEKAGALLDQGIHLLLVDLHPPTSRDPQGIHGAVWGAITGQDYTAPGDKPLTLAAYESDMALRAYVEPVAVGDMMPDMPLFLAPRAHVLVPLETTYQRAIAALPRRWRAVLEGSG